MMAVQILPDARDVASDSGRRRAAAPHDPVADACRRRGWESHHGSRRILGMRVDATTYAETTAAVVDLATSGAGGMICVANVHMVMEAFDDAEFRELVNSADRVTPDGVPLVKALRRMGVPRAERVYGPTLTPEVCKRAEELGLSVGFYGGSPEILDALQARLLETFPHLQIDFAHAPPFRPLDAAEDAAVVDAIRASGVKILFVGLGCPKQERWMAAHLDALDCVQLGVGAAFDFIAGRKRQAPAWMQRIGLEWLFRLATEPQRLWRRYLVGNPRFLYHLARSRMGAAGRVSLPVAPPR
jgi:N-acetylglucosaminyldiphosphoundecaprenol N-acetyl-beta-D-mannosaminyltransferase